MKKGMILAVWILAALWTGCAASQAETAPAETGTAAVTETETVTGTPTETAVTEPETAAPSETAVPAVSETEAEPTEEPTIEPLTEPISYSHRLEVMNTAFGTRPVPDFCYRLDPEKQSVYVRRAIEEEREMYGRVSCWFVDHQTGDVYVCMNFGATEFSGIDDYGFYRVDGSSGEVNALCDAAWLKENRDLIQLGSGPYGIYWVGGKLLFASFGGFYQLEEETGEFLVIDGDWDPQGGYGLIGRDAVKLACAVSGVYEYDPRTGTKTPTEEFRGSDEMFFVGDYLMRPLPHLPERFSAEGESGGEVRLLFEWE